MAWLRQHAQYPAVVSTGTGSVGWVTGRRGSGPWARACSAAAGRRCTCVGPARRSTVAVISHLLAWIRRPTVATQLRTSRGCVTDGMNELVGIVGVGQSGAMVISALAARLAAGAPLGEPPGVIDVPRTTPPNPA